MIAIFFALISYLGWGSGDIFGTIASRKIGGYSTSVWSVIFGILTSSLFIPFFIGEFERVSISGVLLTLFLGVILLGSFLAFNEGLRLGNASLVGTIAASFAALVVLLSIIFLGERINFQQFLSMIIIFIGFILSSLDFKSLKERKIFNKGIVLAIIAMLGWGIFYTFIKLPIQEMGWFWATYISLFAFPIYFVYGFFKRIKLEKPTKNRALPHILANEFLLSGGGYSFNIGISLGLTSVVAPIAGSYPTLFVVLAFLIFKDPITRQQIAGIITTLIGIILLSVFSV